MNEIIRYRNIIASGGNLVPSALVGKTRLMESLEKEYPFLDYHDRLIAKEFAVACLAVAVL